MYKFTTHNEIFFSPGTDTLFSHQNKPFSCTATSSYVHNQAEINQNDISHIMRVLCNRFITARNGVWEVMF